MTKLQEDMRDMQKQQQSGSWQEKTCHNAIVKLEILEQLVAHLPELEKLVDALIVFVEKVGDYSDVRDIVDEEQEELRQSETNEEGE